MLRSIETIYGCPLLGLDGEIGRMEQFFFDEAQWRIRYFVVRTGGWLRGKRILIPAIAVRDVDWKACSARVSIRKKDLQEAGPLEAPNYPGQPVSREAEIRFFNQFRWPYYWTGAGFMGVETSVLGGPFPSGLPDSARFHSTRTILGYSIETEDQMIGHVEDLIVDEVSWTIRYLILGILTDPVRLALIAPQWIDFVQWDLSAMRIGLSRDQILRAPEYQRDAPITRRYEEELFSYYGKKKYWEVPKAA